jgi:hypothetical protein
MSIHSSCVIRDGDNDRGLASVDGAKNIRVYLVTAGKFGTDR